jgi:hypothetical protein
MRIKNIAKFALIGMIITVSSFLAYPAKAANQATVTFTPASASAKVGQQVQTTFKFWNTTPDVMEDISLQFYGDYGIDTISGCFSYDTQTPLQPGFYLPINCVLTPNSKMVTKGTIEVYSGAKVNGVIQTYRTVFTLNLIKESTPTPTIIQTAVPTATQTPKATAKPTNQATTAPTSSTIVTQSPTDTATTAPTSTESITETPTTTQEGGNTTSESTPTPSQSQIEALNQNLSVPAKIGFGLICCILPIAGLIFLALFLIKRRKAKKNTVETVK